MKYRGNMKKAFLIMVLCMILIFSCVACNNTVAPPGASWADKETIIYDVTDENNETMGTLTTIIERNPTDKTIDEKEYSSATSKLFIQYTNGNESMIITSLLENFKPLATKKIVATTEKNYELSSYYSGKYYYYNLKQNGNEKNDKIKIKDTYIDNELLYTYLRCFDPKDMNKELNIPDALNGNYETIVAITTGTTDISIPFPTENSENPIENKIVSCDEISISRSSSPIGDSIKVFYAPDNDEYKILGGLGSEDSSKFPVKIIENNLTYTIASIKVS